MKGEKERVEEDEFIYSEINQKIDGQVSQEGIIFFGITMSGKTTMHNTIQKKEMAPFKKGGTDRIAVTNDPQNGINHETTSADHNPRVYYDGLKYWVDYPGLHDTKSQERQLKNAISLRSLLKKLKKIKFIIFLTEGSLEGVVQMKSILENLNSLFIDQINQNFARHCVFVITRVTKELGFRQNTQQKLRSIHTGLSGVLNERLSNFFKALLDNGIYIFCKYPMNSEVNSKQISSEIEQKINKSHYFQHQNNVKISLSKEARTVANNIFLNISNNIQKIYLTLKTDFLEHFNEQLVQSKASEQLRLIQKQLKCLMEKKFQLKCNEIYGNFHSVIQFCERFQIFKKDLHKDNQKDLKKMDQLIQYRIIEINFLQNIYISQMKQIFLSSIKMIQDFERSKIITKAKNILSVVGISVLTLFATYSFFNFSDNPVEPANLVLKNIEKSMSAQIHESVMKTLQILVNAHSSVFNSNIAQQVSNDVKQNLREKAKDLVMTQVKQVATKLVESTFEEYPQILKEKLIQITTQKLISRGISLLIG